MNIGFVGLGKLGLPLAFTLAEAHHVYAIDTNPHRMSPDAWPTHEPKPTFIGQRRPSFHTDLHAVVEQATDLIFVAVQTPHEPAFDGSKQLPDVHHWTDFDYAHLQKALLEINEACHTLDVYRSTAVISTVLPGTHSNLFEGKFDRLNYIYNPSFIAMGSAVHDFLHPEFVLIGTNEHDPRDVRSLMEGVYKPLIDHPSIIGMSIPSAELTKVAYNTFITQKIVFANALMELSDKIPGCDVDAVTMALKHANRRVTSGAYLSAGMGDGGACHPRDNIALGHLAHRHDLFHNPFQIVVEAREKQAAFLAELLDSKSRDLPLVILGTAYKAHNSSTEGSAALLVADYIQNSLKRDVILCDPVVEPNLELNIAGPYACLIGCNHTGWKSFVFPPGSVVIDPWAITTDEDQPGVTIIRVGRS